MHGKIINRVNRILVIILVAISQFAIGQKNPDDKLPVDPALKKGSLPNGLTYYIRQNKKPEQKAELRLVLNAGSILEDEDQQGLAHMLEHMAFNGTTNFKKNDIVSFLQSIGVAFGNDLNAYTSFDETVFMLPIPLDKSSNLENGFKIISDWAHNITNKNDDIDAERPVVLEESRLGKGADDRMFRKLYPALFAGSMYAKRLPIGVDSIIKNHKYESLRRFYHDWYRPDLMAVMVVGDIDPSAIETLIKKYFSTLSNPANERPRIYTGVPPYQSDSAMVITDKEATDYVIQLNYAARKVEASSTLGGYRNDLVKQIFSSILNQRLNELTQKENPPFLYAGAGFGSYARSYESFSAQMASGTSDPLIAISSFLLELEKIKRFGFTAAELERTKKDMLSHIESSFKEKGKTESSAYVEEYTRNFLTQETIPGIEKEYEYYRLLLPLITLEEVNASASFLKQNTHKFIALTGPEVSSVKLPTPAQMLAKIDEMERTEIIVAKEKVLATSLITKMPVPGKILSTTKNAILGTTEYKLVNGVTVTLKPTTFKNDEVMVSSVRAGGTGQFGVADKHNVQYATSVISSMGIGDFSPVDLQKVLAGKTATVSPYISRISEGISGNSTVKDMETLFQLIYLYHTNPRTDTSLFKSFLQKNKAQYSFLSANPEYAFIDTIGGVLYNNNPLAPVMVPKASDFDKVSLNRAMQIYMDKFGDVNGAHFTFVGSFKPENIKPLIEKYIASLPSTSKKFGFVDNGVTMLKGKKKVEFFRGKEQKSLTLTVFGGDLPYTEAMDLKAQAISEILNIRIIEELREKIQGIYTGGISARFDKYPVSRYRFILQLPSGPDKVDTLLYAIDREIAKLKANGPTVADLNKVKQQWIENQKESIKDNGEWLTQLQEMYLPGKDIRYFTNFNAYVKALTVADIREAARVLLNGSNVFTAILRPEKK